MEHFSFLRDYGFELVKAEKDNYGCRLTFQNKWTAIQIQLDVLGPGMVIDCYRLKNGVVPIYPIFFDPQQEFLVFDINDLFVIKSGRKFDQDPGLMYEEHYMRTKIKEAAGMVHRDAIDILSGDFSLLPKIKERAARRAKELEHEQ